MSYVFDFCVEEYKVMCLDLLLIYIVYSILMEKIESFFRFSKEGVEVKVK